MSYLTALWSTRLLIEKIKYHMKDIVNISIEYSRYNLVANFYNCLLIEIIENGTSYSSLVFLTGDGVKKTFDLRNDQNINVKVKSI